MEGEEGGGAPCAGGLSMGMYGVSQKFHYMLGNQEVLGGVDYSLIIF